MAKAVLAKRASKDAVLVKIDRFTDGSFPYVNRVFKELAESNLENAAALCEFLEQQQNEKNVKISTVETYIKRVCWLSKFHQHAKSWKEMTREDIQAFLLSNKKTEEADPRHKWVGTFNSWLSLLIGFFRWVHNHEKTLNRDDWITPDCVKIKRLKRPEESTYTPEQIWTAEDHETFLKYCPHKMFKAYHSMSMDCSGRPAEILSCNISDIKFRISSIGRSYAFVEIRESKTKTRTLPLIVSVPYLKDWLADHPLRNSPNSPLFISLRADTFGKRIKRWSVYNQYVRYKSLIFPRLLEDEAISEADKSRIRIVLSKPWNPYLSGRHSSLTEVSKHLSDSLFRQHGSWSRNSKMPGVYVHYFSNQSAKALLAHYGIEPKEGAEGHQSRLKPKECPNCRTPNVPDAKFCTNEKCRMILTYDGIEEIRIKEKQKEEELQSVKTDVQKMLKQLYAAGVIKPE